MTLAEVHDDRSLQRFMTEPSPALTEAAARIDGPVLVLGGSGKMGPELAATLRRADRAAGVERDVVVASTFSDDATRAALEADGIRCIRGDLTDPGFIGALPESRQVVYMLGFKFGSGTDWRRAFHVNSIVPYLVGERFGDANIVVFSSTNPYAGVDYVAPAPAGGERTSVVGPPVGGGSRESDALQPEGVYGWSIAAREASFATTASRHARAARVQLSSGLRAAPLLRRAARPGRHGPPGRAGLACGAGGQPDLAARCRRRRAALPGALRQSAVDGQRVRARPPGRRDRVRPGGRAGSRPEAGRRRRRHAAADRR